MWGTIYKMIMSSISFGTLMATSTASLSLCTSFSHILDYQSQLFLAFLITLIATFGYATCISLFNKFYTELRRWYNSYNYQDSKFTEQNLISIADKIDDLSDDQLTEIFKRIPKDKLKKIISDSNNPSS